MVIRSFETGEGEQFGDLLSKERLESEYQIKVGLVTTGYFEYWRMYPTLKAKVEADSQEVAERLKKICHLVYPGVIDTIDSADAAGRRFKNENIDLLLISYRTYIPDIFIHQILTHIRHVPIAFIISRPGKAMNIKQDYEECLRNMAMMANVQLTGGFRKIGIYENFEVFVGDMYDNELYSKINKYLNVVNIYESLRRMTIGVVGQVFRGMFDFEYDKTVVKGILGPEVIHIQIHHLLDLWEKIMPEDKEVKSLVTKVKKSYKIVGLEERDIIAAARFAVCLRKLVQKFRLDGIVLLGQHFVEAHTKTTSYLGMAELHEEGKVLGVTEGDVLGLIMMKIMRALTNKTPYFGEWSEFDIERNAIFLNGHGFGDPTLAKKGYPVVVCPAAEQWGLEGKGLGFEFTYDPGPVTFGHFIQDAKGWRMLIGKGEVLDIEPIPCSEVHMLMKVERPVEEFVEILVKQGWPHHCIVVPGDVRKELSQLANLLKIEKIFL
jgi:L-arabinose isomerase